LATTYRPAPQPGVQSAQRVSFSTSHALTWYCPAAHTVHAAHTVSTSGVHASATYRPTPHHVPGRHAMSRRQEHSPISQEPSGQEAVQFLHRGVLYGPQGMGRLAYCPGPHVPLK
jgi:hypothetical protein